MACVQDLGLLWQPSTPLTVFRLLNVRCRYAFVGGPCEERRCQPKPRSHFTDRPLGLTGMASSITTPDGVRIAYHEVGAGDPPIVFVHGIYGNRLGFGFQEEYFSPNHHCVAVDLRGNGDSDKPDEVYSPGSRGRCNSALLEGV